MTYIRLICSLPGSPHLYVLASKAPCLRKSHVALLLDCLRGGRRLRSRQSCRCRTPRCIRRAPTLRQQALLTLVAGMLAKVPYSVLQCLILECDNGMSLKDIAYEQLYCEMESCLN